MANCTNFKYFFWKGDISHGFAIYVAHSKPVERSQSDRKANRASGLDVKATTTRPQYAIRKPCPVRGKAQLCPRNGVRACEGHC